MQVACFYELGPSDVGKIVGKISRIRIIVSGSSGCLDPSGTTSKYSLSRNHFNMNKFVKNTEDFDTVSDVIKKMIRTSMAGSLIQQSALGTKRRLSQSDQIENNKRARSGHQSNSYSIVCYGCNQAGHLRPDCPDWSKDRCYNCGEKGHRSKYCPERRYIHEDRDEESEDGDVDDDEDVEGESESDDTSSDSGSGSEDGFEEY